MKKLICGIMLLLTGIFLAAAAPDSVRAQNYNHSLITYVSVGFSDPTGDLDVGTELGYFVSADFGFRLVPRVEALLGVDYNSFNMDILKIANITGGRFWAALLGSGIKVYPGVAGSEINPFLTARGGVAMVDFTGPIIGFTAGGSIIADSDIRPYFELGGGFEFSQVYVSLRFVDIFLEQSDARFISGGVGVRLNLI